LNLLNKNKTLLSQGFISVYFSIIAEAKRVFFFLIIKASIMLFQVL